MSLLKSIPTLDDVRARFKYYTQYTVPSHSSYLFYDKLPRPYEVNAQVYHDDIGNVFYVINNENQDAPVTAFLAHMDDVSYRHSQVQHEDSERYITNGNPEILGADDKAGVTILSFLMDANVPGVYCFFVDEEIGCVGSGHAVREYAAGTHKLYSGLPKYTVRKTKREVTVGKGKDVTLSLVEDTEVDYLLGTPLDITHPFTHLKHAVSFDRKGYSSIVTHQSGGRTASDEFADALGDALAAHGIYLSADDGGVYTDSREFQSIVSECTNLSVGYFNAHRHTEIQDIWFLYDLTVALLQIDWSLLPATRSVTPVPSRKSYKSFAHFDDDKWSPYPSTWNDAKWADIDTAAYSREADVQDMIVTTCTCPTCSGISPRQLDDISSDIVFNLSHSEYLEFEKHANTWESIPRAANMLYTHPTFEGYRCPSCDTPFTPSDWEYIIEALEIYSPF